MNPTISINGDDFVLVIPGSHTIRIPINEPDKLVAMLQARRTAQLRIAEPGSPTQWNIDRATEVASIDAFAAAKNLADLHELGIL